jgi:hypothetical protein
VFGDSILEQVGAHAAGRDRRGAHGRHPSPTLSFIPSSSSPQQSLKGAYMLRSCEDRSSKQRFSTL